MTKSLFIFSMLLALVLPIQLSAQDNESSGQHIIQISPTSQVDSKTLSIHGSLLQQIEEKGFATVYIGFNINSADIMPEYLNEIKGIYQLLLSQEDLCLLVEGHTDTTGNASYNKELSLRRAQSVKSSLTMLGIADIRLTVEGQGGDRPIADNRTPSGREQNRRVELHKITCVK